MRLQISTEINCSFDAARKEVLRTRLTQHVAYPLAMFTPIEPKELPEQWKTGKYLVRLFVLGFIPFGKHSVVISIPGTATPDTCFQMRDNGYGDVITKWDHLVTIQKSTDSAALYTDEVVVEAGVLTPLVWMFASLFYRYRQARWRKLVANKFRSIHDDEH